MSGALATTAIAAPAFAAKTYTVTTTADNETNGSGCSLREAMRIANTGVAKADCPGANNAELADVVIVSSGSTYNLSSPITITQDVTLKGSSTSSLATINGPSGERAVISISGMTIAYLENLTLKHSSAIGYGVYIVSGAHAYMRRSVVRQNRIGIVVEGGGNLTLDFKVAVHDNLNPGGEGGGILSLGSNSILHVEKSSIYKNRAWRGAGVYNRGNFEVRDTTITQNTSEELGGGVLSDGDNARVDFLGVTLTRNTSSQCWGAGLVRFGFGFINYGYSIVSGNGGCNCEGIFDDGLGQISSSHSIVTDDCFPYETDPGNTEKNHNTDSPGLSSSTTTQFPENIGFKPASSTALPRNKGGEDLDSATDQHGKTRRFTPGSATDGVDIGALEYQ